MAESTLSVTYHELLRELGRFLGWGRNPGRWKEDDKSDAEDCIKSGLRQFYIPLPLDGKSHRWSFLDPLQTFSAVEPYSTGTVTIVNGVVTLAGGTFPTWVAGATGAFPSTAPYGDLRIGSVNYRIASTTSNTVVTLSDTTLDAAAGSSYSVVQQVYDLPADFGGMVGPILFRAGSTNFKTRIAQRSEIEVRKIAAEVHLGEPGEPSYYAVRPKTYSGGAIAGQRFELVFDCPTDAAYTFEYRYQIEPNAIDFTNIYPYGGAKHSETIIESVMAAAEIRFHDDANGPRRQRFLELLKASIEKDRAEFTPDSLGVDYGDRGNCCSPRQVRTYFEGVEIA
jgi:hypothetical protein